MKAFSRRAFLGASLAGASLAWIGSKFLFRDEPGDRVKSSKVPAPPVVENIRFKPNTLFLTWQRDPTTTMTIQWIGKVGEATNTTIFYSPVPSMTAVGTVLSPPPLSQSTTVKPYPLSDLKIFRSELTGLSPGTDYTFRIGNQSPVYRFRTMPAKATDTIHFISGGDCGVNVHAVANNIQAARQDPMFALIGGDLGYDDGMSLTASLGFIKNYSQHMIGRNGHLIPMVACIGNHEVEGGYNKPREKAPFFYAMFDGLFPEKGFATLDFGDYLSLVLLDTGHTSAIEGEQADWLETELRARVEHPHVMVVNHVPAYPSHRNMAGSPIPGGGTILGTGEGNRQHWVPLFEKYRVPVILEHHDHTFKRTKPLVDGLYDKNGVIYLGDGSWGQLRTPNAPEKLPFLAETSRDYHISLHRLEGEERFHLALDENGRVMDVCKTGQRTKG